MSAKSKHFLRELLSWGAYIVGGLLAALILSQTVLVNAEVTSGSMENTIMTNDRIAGLRVAYLFSEPKRLDIVVFENPITKGDTPFVKRIIGLPGETVSFRDNQVYINDELLPLDEPYLAELMVMADCSYEVPEGCYFMLGDNRNKSTDSRYLTNGYIPREDIIGKVYFSWFPHFRVLQ